MANFREVNDDDILKKWFNYREQEVFASLTEEDKNIIFILMKLLRIF